MNRFIVCSVIFFAVVVIIFILGNLEIGNLGLMRTLCIGLYVVATGVLSFPYFRDRDFLEAGARLGEAGILVLAIEAFASKIINPNFVTEVFDYVGYVILFLGLLTVMGHFSYRGFTSYRKQDKSMHLVIMTSVCVVFFALLLGYGAYFVANSYYFSK